MTKAVFLILGQSQCSHFRKIGFGRRHKPKVQSFVNFAFGTPSVALGFCNYLLVTTIFPFASNMAYFGEFLL